MQRVIIGAMLAAATLMADVTVGADAGKYKAGDTTLYAEQLKVGYGYRDFNFYVYGQHDTLKEVLSVSDTSCGAGIDYSYKFVTVGTSYGQGKVLGWKYSDATAKLGLTYTIDFVTLEAGVKAKRMEIDNSHDDFIGGYAGISGRF